MPVVDGVDVHTVLERDGAMSPHMAVRVVEQVAAALDSAHKSGLVHRDVKPSNLLMVGGEFVYLIDFGLVHEATAARLTRTNVTQGSPAYMAPERFTAGGIADARADVYSLACVLYECLTAQLPFAGRHLRAVGRRSSVHRAAPAQQLQRRDPGRIRRGDRARHGQKARRPLPNRRRAGRRRPPSPLQPLRHGSTEGSGTYSAHRLQQDRRPHTTWAGADARQGTTHSPGPEPTLVDDAAFELPPHPG